MATVTIYTDGACNPNPGPGGWAALIIYPDGEMHELTGGDPATTSNRMELTAAIKALRHLSTPQQVHLYTDSAYLRQGITNWLPHWREQGWQTTKKSQVKNRDLWQALVQEAERHSVTWHWVKGHADDRWNKRVDHLARAAIPRPSLPTHDPDAIHIFTGAAYLSKSKRGGWGVVLRYRDRYKELNGNADHTSPNRMHLQAAIKGLEAIKRPLPVHLYTTSNYLYHGATRWLAKWARNGWHTREGPEVKNRDLWERLQALLQKQSLEWHLVVGRDLADMQRAKELAAIAAGARPGPSGRGRRP